MASDNKVENRLPFVSARVFIHSKPMSDPIENIVWKMTLSTCF